MFFVLLTLPVFGAGVLFIVAISEVSMRGFICREDKDLLTSGHVSETQTTEESMSNLLVRSLFPPSVRLLSSPSQAQTVAHLSHCIKSIVLFTFKHDFVINIVCLASIMYK